MCRDRVQISALYVWLKELVADGGILVSMCLWMMLKRDEVVGVLI